MLLPGHDQVIAHQLVKLALGDAGQGRGNAQAREEQGHRPGHAQDGHKHALLVAEDVAGRHLLGEA